MERSSIITHVEQAALDSSILEASKEAEKTSRYKTNEVVSARWNGGNYFQGDPNEVYDVQVCMGCIWSCLVLVGVYIYTCIWFVFGVECFAFLNTCS